MFDNLSYHSRMTALDRAIEIVGGVSALASALRTSQPRVSQWRKRGTLIDAKECVAIERATAGAVTRRDLRPDDWAEIWPELADSPAGAAPVAIESEVMHG